MAGHFASLPEAKNKVIDLCESVPHRGRHRSREVMRRMRTHELTLKKVETT